ncbi:TonB-dependent receptor [Sphingosinithalassobacter portus]|uniref:TonB-dependent receptor n=1 Tax=Stakelama portus TaxID=2676234 RepID=UPI000D6DE27B|nr:TonB-dependent receptor [Sphingosinithalassobacter portus]
MRPLTPLWCGVALAIPGAAWAQVAPAQQDPEIVVTALRRETRLQDTPLAVTVVSGRALSAAGIRELTGIPLVPGLGFVDSGPSNTRLIVRGIQTVGEPTVGLYYDEVPVSGVVGPANDAGGNAPRLKLFDVERVEVLRGPQGTLFGSGSMGGTVRVLFRKPDDSWAARVEGEASWTEGGGFNHGINAMVNIPVASGIFAVRAVGYDDYHAGYIDNPVLGLTNFNSDHSYGGRLLARLTPTPDLTLDAAVQYQHGTGDRPIWYGEQGPYQAVNQVRLPSLDELTIYSLTARWDGPGFTGTATGSIAHRRYEVAISDPSYFFQSQQNNPATCARLRGGGNPCTPAMQSAFNDYVQDYVHGLLTGLQRSTTHTGELRFASTGAGWLQWTAGGFVSDRHAFDDNNQFKADPVTGEVLQPLIRQTERVIDDWLTQYAGYGELSATPVGWMTATVGLRYFDYRRKVGGNTVVPLDLINARASAYTMVSSNDSGWVFKGNIAVRPTADLMFYAQAEQGFRPGGVNQVIGLPAELGPYRSDSLWTYELGVKSSWLDHMATLNIALYRTDWHDMQVGGSTPAGPFQIISNAGAARITGVEVEATLRPARGLELSAAGSYTDAKLSEDQRNANIIATGRRGDRIPYVPRFAAGGSASYSWQAAPDVQAHLRLDVTHVGASASEFRPDNVFYRRLPAYTLVNLTADVDLKQGWSVGLFAANLFDEVAITASTANGVSAGRTLNTSARPRTLGVRIGKDF